MIPRKDPNGPCKPRCCQLGRSGEGEGEAGREGAKSPAVADGSDSVESLPLVFSLVGPIGRAYATLSKTVDGAYYVTRCLCRALLEDVGVIVGPNGVYLCVPHGFAFGNLVEASGNKLKGGGGSWQSR